MGRQNIVGVMRQWDIPCVCVCESAVATVTTTSQRKGFLLTFRITSILRVYILSNVYVYMSDNNCDFSITPSSQHTHTVFFFCFYSVYFISNENEIRL